MITVRLNEIEYSIKNKIDELNIKEFEEITNILTSQETDKLEKYTLIFSFFNIPIEILDDLDISTFFKLIEDFTKEYDNDINYFIKEKDKEIIIDGKRFIAYEGDTFKMNVKQMKIIEKYIRLYPKNYISYLLAIIFKDENLTENEHYLDSHIKLKAKLFSEKVTANIALPYVGFFSKELFNNLKLYSTL